LTQKFVTQLAIKYLFKFPPHLMSVQSHSRSLNSAPIENQFTTSY